MIEFAQQDLGNILMFISGLIFIAAAVTGIKHEAGAAVYLPIGLMWIVLAFTL